MDANKEEEQREAVEKGKINFETAKIAWQDLERFFAAGSVVYVSPELALIDVAYALSQNDSGQFKAWMDAKKVAHVSDEQAIAWHDSSASVWSVVVKPWILVQDINRD